MAKALVKRRPGVRAGIGPGAGAADLCLGIQISAGVRFRLESILVIPCKTISYIATSKILQERYPSADTLAPALRLLSSTLMWSPYESFDC